MKTQFVVNAGTDVASFMPSARLVNCLPQKQDGKTLTYSDWYSLAGTKFPLPDATVWVVDGVFSRTKLTKLLGKKAMVRGVKQV